MKNFCLIITLLFVSIVVDAQDIKQLQKKYAATKNTKDKLIMLDSIATYYLMDGDKDSLAKVTAEKQIEIAQRSGDKKVMTLAQLLVGRRWQSMGGVNDVERLKYGYAALTKALEMSRDYNQPDLEAEACIQLAMYYRHNRINQLDKSMEYVNQAQSVLAANPNDSLSVLNSRIAGGIHYSKGDHLAAFRFYTNALNTAERIDNPSLIADTYMSLGTFYTALDDYTKAIDYMTKAYKLLESNNLVTSADNLLVLSRIGNVYATKRDYKSARAYYWKMHDKAKKMKLHEIMVNQPLFYILATYLEEKNDKELLKYIADPRLIKIIKQYKQDYMLDFYRAVVFDHQKKTDSATYYFNRVIKPAEAAAPPVTLFAIYSSLGFTNIKNGQPAVGLQWMEKAKDVSIKMNDLSILSLAYHELDSAYAITGNKAKAYDYRVLYDKYNDSLKNESKSRLLTLAEVNAEGQRLKAQEAKREEALRKKHNLQYMGITAAIATVFMILVLTGIFTTSTSIIRGLGFFAFIFFFEFITLLCDHVIHDFTHGEPLKIMAIKIVFVALLLPLHHFVEEKVIHHLIHRKKIKLSKLAILRSKAEVVE